MMEKRMKYSKSIIIVLFLLVVFSCSAENSKDGDHFEGVWCIDAQNRSIDDFLIIQKIKGSYLVITADTDDDGSVKSIGKKKTDNILEVELRGNNYTIKWDSDENGEWLEMYINPNVEDYPIYERVETFSLDKF